MLSLCIEAMAANSNNLLKQYIRSVNKSFAGHKKLLHEVSFSGLSHPKQINIVSHCFYVAVLKGIVI